MSKLFGFWIELEAIGEKWVEHVREMSRMPQEVACSAWHTWHSVRLPQILQSRRQTRRLLSHNGEMGRRIRLATWTA
jgi:hypothetical protein